MVKPQPTEWQRIGNQIDAAMIPCAANLVNVVRFHFRRGCRGTVACVWTEGCGLCDEGRPLRRLKSRKDLHARATQNRKRLFCPPAILRLPTRVVV